MGVHYMLLNIDEILESEFENFNQKSDPWSWALNVCSSILNILKLLKIFARPDEDAESWHRQIGGPTDQ
jgi:hypothetical protein